MGLKFIFEEEKPEAGGAANDRRALVPVYGTGRGRAVAVPSGAIVISADHNFGDEFEDELMLLPAPDTLEEVPDEEADMRALRRIYKSNPRLLAKFMAEIGLEVLPPSTS